MNRTLRSSSGAKDFINIPQLGREKAAVKKLALKTSSATKEKPTTKEKPKVLLNPSETMRSQIQGFGYSKKKGVSDWLLPLLTKWTCLVVSGFMSVFSLVTKSPEKTAWLFLFAVAVWMISPAVGMFWVWLGPAIHFVYSRWKTIVNHLYFVLSMAIVLLLGFSLWIIVRYMFMLLFRLPRLVWTLTVVSSSYIGRVTANTYKKVNMGSNNPDKPVTFSTSLCCRHIVILLRALKAHIIFKTLLRVFQAWKKEAKGSVKTKKRPAAEEGMDQCKIRAVTSRKAHTPFEFHPFKPSSEPSEGMKRGFGGHSWNEISKEARKEMVPKKKISGRKKARTGDITQPTESFVFTGHLLRSDTSNQSVFFELDSTGHNVKAQGKTDLINKNPPPNPVETITKDIIEIEEVEPSAILPENAKEPVKPPPVRPLKRQNRMVKLFITFFYEGAVKMFLNIAYLSANVCLWFLQLVVLAVKACFQTMLIWVMEVNSHSPNRAHPHVYEIYERSVKRGLKNKDPAIVGK